MQMDMNLHLVNPWAHRLLHLPRFVGSVVAVTESRVWRLIGCYIRTCMIQNMSVSWLVDVSFSLFFLWTLSVSLLAAILCVPCCFPLLCALSLFSQLLLIPPALHYCPLLFSITRCCSRLNSFVPCCSLLPPIGFPYSVLSLLVPIDTQSIHNTNDVWNNYMTLQWNVAISLLLMILKHICCNFIGEVSAHRFLWIWPKNSSSGNYEECCCMKSWRTKQASTIMHCFLWE